MEAIILAEIIADLVQAKEGDACIHCGNPLSVLSTICLNDDFENILLALAETYHDDKGLTLPHPAAPFDVYLMHHHRQGVGYTRQS